MPDLIYISGRAKGWEKGSNTLIIPVKCMNPECRIEFYEHYKFDTWTATAD